MSAADWAERGRKAQAAVDQIIADSQDIPEPDGFAAKKSNEAALAAVRARMTMLRETRDAIHRELASLRIQEDFLARMVKLGETMSERIEGEADDPGTEEEE